jgi:hypothetical protein
MSIPLDRLYEFIETAALNACDDNVVIYRFWPHGSKNIKDLMRMRTYTWSELLLSLPIVCHDQEPLDFEANQDNSDHVFHPHSKWYQLLVNHGMAPKKFNLRWAGNIFDRCVLLHSEQRSADVEKYLAHDYVPTYYWSHAIIALDWFRYAQHTDIKPDSTKQFLIYNRAWSGTREYRLKFAELLLEHDLISHCRTWLNPVDPQTQQHYQDHKFQGPQWRPNRILDQEYPCSTVTACYSADIDIKDYASTDIEVVLETLFDDNRLHLTEKSLRPIACGQPFVLAATHGSLEYLRSYGFQTFSDLWDESYDQETDPVRRLQKIVQLMVDMSRWSPERRNNIMQQARLIAQANKQHFFSQAFRDQVIRELSTNLQTALHEIQMSNRSQKFFTSRRQLATVPEIQQILTNVTDHPDRELHPEFFKNYNRQNILQVVKRARQYYYKE